LVNLLKIIPLLIALIPMPALAAGKHALLIGIHDYKLPVNPLKGPANDVKLTKEMLRERFSFQDEDFIILLNEKATHTGIENAFKELIGRVNSGDFVYIYYSGHGSQTADLNDDEADGDKKDETWVSYGSRSSMDKHKDNYDVLDDEIGAWLVDLYAKTDQVVFVSDSCHSATVSRAVERGEALVRAVEEDKRPHLLGERTYAKPKKHKHIGVDAAPEPLGIRVDAEQEPPGIRVSAARDYESAADGLKIDDELKKDDQPNGVFTWYWVQSLQQAQKGYTWHDVFKQTYAQVTAIRGITQQPQMEGDGRQQVLGGGFKPHPKTISIRAVPGKSRAVISAGSLVGVTKGSIYRLYQPEASNPQNLPRLTIEEVGPFTSYGKPEPKGAFKTGNLVVEESHAYHFVPFKVQLKADFPKQDKSLLEAIQSAFQSTSNDHTFFPYMLTDDSPDLRLHLLRPKALEDGQFIYEKDDALPKSFPNQQPELWVLTPDGLLFNENLQIAFNNPTEGVKLLKDNLKKWARLREIKALQSSHPVPVKVQIEIWSHSQSESEAENCFVDENLGSYCQTGQYSLSDFDKHTPSLGDVLRFTLNNQSDKPYYCYLINLSPDGAINVIYPYQTTEYTSVKPGDKNKRQTSLSVYLQNQGKRTLKLFTSTQKINDISLFEQSTYKPERLKSLEKSLERLLVNTVHGLRGTRSTLNDEWATEQATFDVK